MGNQDSPGGRLTIATAKTAGRPLLIVEPGVTTRAAVRDWIAARGIRTLNVAGNRESTEPGIGERAERFLNDGLPAMRSISGRSQRISLASLRNGDIGEI